jgi:hypothetical protein
VLAALDSVPLITDVLVGAGLGALVGSIVAQRHQRKGGRIPHEWIVTRWSVIGAIAGPLVSTLVSRLAEL